MVQAMHEKKYAQGFAMPLLCGCAVFASDVIQNAVAGIKANSGLSELRRFLKAIHVRGL